MSTETAMSPAELQQAARDHLWMHFTRMSSYLEGDIPIIVRGDGCYLEDSNGKRYLDALAGLFAVQIGYGYGEEMGRRQRRRCGSFRSTRTGATPTRARSSWPRRLLRSRRAT